MPFLLQRSKGDDDKRGAQSLISVPPCDEPPRPADEILALLLAGSLAALANPWIAGKLTQGILNGPQPDLPSFQLILLSWFALLVVKSLLGFGSSWLVGTNESAWS